MAVTVEGELPAGVTAKDVVLAIIGSIGTGGGIGHVIEYRGSAIRVAVDGGPDDGVQHVASRPGPGPGWSRPTRPPSPTWRAGTMRPTGASWEHALADWRTLATDDGAAFDER